MITLIRWYLRKKIDRVKLLSETARLEKSDIRYDGKSEDYWFGYAKAMQDSLKVLGLEKWNIPT